MLSRNYVNLLYVTRAFNGKFQRFRIEPRLLGLYILCHYFFYMLNLFIKLHYVN